MADGFFVDFGALYKAAEGVTDTLGAMATRKVSDVDAPKHAFGHDRLAGTVADFCDRWEIGVEHLTKDAQAIADQLNACVNAYLHVDATIRKTFDGIVQRASGPDPAAQ
ncbi:MAG TPA: hypothetical protein VF054_20350 [Micromonosporaceae bacterium]